VSYSEGRVSNIRRSVKVSREQISAPLLLASFALMVCLWSISLAAQTPAAPTQPAVPMQGAQNLPPSISLSPAVVMAKGNFGQGLTQTLTITNQTAREFAFEMVAEDVIVKNGQRVFVPAGETPDGIAASAVFSQKTVTVKPFSSASVDVRLTLPKETGIRAIVAMFRGTDKIASSSGAVGMTASLGTLITFNLSENIKLEQDAAHVKPATDSANMSITQFIANKGSEPVLPEGAAAVLNAKGALVGKAIFAPQRLLPGERIQFVADYPDQLPPGDYRVLCSFQFEGKTLTNSADFKIP
jgi:hypothetical protein